MVRSLQQALELFSKTSFDWGCTVQVNGSYVRRLRQGRGWPQQQLADAAGLSLRTVQRIEKAGNASHESILCLCATLDVEISDVRALPNKNDIENMETAFQIHPVITLAALLLGMIIGSIVTILFFT